MIRIATLFTALALVTGGALPVDTAQAQVTTPQTYTASAAGGALA